LTTDVDELKVFFGRVKEPKAGRSSDAVLLLVFLLN
jgi:extradiol dioxygenase family protein